jgi:hypothetical protein
VTPAALQPPGDASPRDAGAAGHDDHVPTTDDPTLPTSTTTQPLSDLDVWLLGSEVVRERIARAVRAANVYNTATEAEAATASERAWPACPCTRWTPRSK